MLRLTALSLYLAAPLLIGGCTSTAPTPARNLQIGTPFSLPATTEKYMCFRQNVTEDIYVNSISTVDAPGVHHQILAVADQTMPEGLTECGLALGDSKSWIFLGGGPAASLTMPTGIAYKISAGSQLLLQLHLFNSGDAPLDSSSTVSLTGVAETEVTDQAQLVEAGTLDISLPPAAAGSASGTCTLAKDVNVFALLPHMHYMGTAFHADITDGSASTTLVDGAFAGLDAARFQTFTPTPMPAGAKLDVKCDYFNSSSSTVVYGSSAMNEMCFALTYYYPAIDTQGPLCIH